MQKSSRKVNGSQTIVPPKEPFIKEEELGACASCSGYHEFGPHIRNDGKVSIRCIPKKTMVQARTDISSPEECEYCSVIGVCR